MTGPFLVEVHNIKALGLMVSDKKIFYVSYISICKTCDPQDGALFGPIMGN